MSCIKKQQGWDASPKMGAKRVSDTSRLENLLPKGRELSWASLSQQRIYLIHLAPFFCAQIIHEKTLMIFFFLNLSINLKRGGRWSAQAELRASSGMHCGRRQTLPPSPRCGDLGHQSASPVKHPRFAKPVLEKYAGLWFWGRYSQGQKAGTGCTVLFHCQQYTGLTQEEVRLQINDFQFASVGVND